MPLLDRLSWTSPRSWLPAGGIGLVFFVHIPKTAGTAVVHALRAPYRDEEICPHYGEYKLGEIPPVEFRRRYRFAAAHAGIDYARPRADHILTVLRDPLERILSLYNYWRSTPLESATVFPGGVIDPAVTLARELDFEGFVHSDHPRILNDIENGQTWQLAASNTPNGRPRLAHSGPGAVLATAEANLRAMEAIGTTEDLAGFAASIEERLGMRIEIGRRNVTRRKSAARDAVGSDALARVEALTALDATLYDRVASGAVAPSWRHVRRRRAALAQELAASE